MKTRFFMGVFLFTLFTQTLSGQDNVEIKPVRNFQLSILPLVGTDGAETVHNRYRASVNLFAGITGGVEGVELGGFLNITDGYLDGIQLSGFGNLVRGNVSGFQGAGFVNIIGGSIKGFAGSGFANITGGDYEGFAGAGFANITGGNFQGFNASGFANITGGSSQGFMAAGFANIAGGNTQGFHAAGFANITGGNMMGPQFAGFMNVAHDMQGLQVSGFLNVAKKVDGLQLGFINLADTISAGIPIGFFSFVKKGGHRQFELAGSDVMFLAASFRTGINAFYNIFTFGMRPFSDERFNSFGYGIGTGIAFSERTSMQLELHTTQLHKNNRWKAKEADLLTECRINLSIKTGKVLEVFAGVVLYNHFASDCPACNYASRDIAPNRTFYEKRWDDYLSRWWLGARGGIRINV